MELNTFNNHVLAPTRPLVAMNKSVNGTLSITYCHCSEGVSVCYFQFTCVCICFVTDQLQKETYWSPI